MIKRHFFPLFCFFCSVTTHAQTLKTLDHTDVHRWRKIEQTRFTGDGQWVAYVLSPVTEGDTKLLLWNARTQQTREFPRATEPRFSEDGRLLVFRIKPPLDTLKAQRRRKVKEDELPKDSLGILTLAAGQLEKIARVRNFALPEKWSGRLAFQLEPDKPAAKPDAAPKADSKKAGKKPKKEDKDSGYRLVVRNTATGRQDTVAYVLSYVFAKRGQRLLLNSTGKGDTLLWAATPKIYQSGVYLFDFDKDNIRPLWRGKGKYQQIALDDTGMQAAFLADTDTTKARIRPWQLCYWSSAQDSARLIADAKCAFLNPALPEKAPAVEEKISKSRKKSNPALASGPIPPPVPTVLKVDSESPQAQNWGISEHFKPVFSENGSKLYFGIAPPPVLNDTTLLPEEIVSVEVWSWTENRLYTQQKNRLEEEKKRSYPVVWHTRLNKFVQLGSAALPEIRFQEQRDADLALGYTEEPYAKAISWEGAANKDLEAVDLLSGKKQRIATNLRCTPRISPAARYIAWWSAPDTAWYAWNAQNATSARLTINRNTAFYNEEDDVPDYPDPYGIGGWLHNDEAVLVYDKFDLWKIDPAGRATPQRLTRGRETETVYRYLRLDPEERSIAPDARLLLHRFSERDKSEGYAWLDLKTGALTPWFSGDYAVNSTPIKAKEAPALVFTKSNFQIFPDLRYAEMPAATGRMEDNSLRISDANPQQSEYKWGSIEPFSWTSLTGEKINGLLVKPAGFDPTKQYPMIVNFYEKLSDELHTHRAPDFGRSQINYTFYASRGYLVFAPDIPYRTGYPGECAYDAIVSGVTALMNKGFVDPKRIALQGHSWGGYQAAYIVTRTNLFACAEAGAPVANMTSAYGGIRWETGLSRAFQYERQQSRIGGSLWEYPMRYLENSPLFALDKVETPVLILHNDKDGAVPWYQGIELYSGLRRLGKPAWMLNYNEEPHWPVKLQNRIDFQKRMQQFFDHYLMGAPEPRWMQRGVPPVEKGILQGLELLGEKP